MKHLTFFTFKSLQGRLILMLLVPVFVTFFIGSVVSFIYTRNIMIDQWRESSVLKLQRAAHNLEMQVLKPIELLNTLHKIPYYQDMTKSKNELMQNLAALEGVVRVGITYSRDSEINELRPYPAMRMGNHGQMQIHRSQILTISEPEYDTDAAEQTVTLFLSLLNPSDEVVGNLEIVMSFKYLLKDIFKMGWWQSNMACIVDQKGKYLVHTNMSMKGREYLGGTDNAIEAAVLDAMKTRASGTIQSGGHPPDMVAGFQRLDHLPWTIILFAKGEKIFKPIIQYRNAFALGGIFLIIIILVLIRLQVGRIVEKIKKLSEKAKKVATGDYGDVLAVETRDEIGQLVQSYNAMVKGLKERDFIRDTFGRYVDPDFASFLLQHPDAGKLGGKRREVAILMSDIRGFTALSETLSPEVIISVLNQYFSHMIAVIKRYNGIIVDFFGDSILVFFEPFSSSMEDTARHCIQCATDMQNEMHRFNQKMKGKNLPELHMGIGINTGQVIVGNIGSETRAKYGIVGSAVNITSRIQAKADEREILVSDAVYQYLKNELQIKKTFRATMKGIDHPMMLHVLKTKSDSIIQT